MQKLKEDKIEVTGNLKELAKYLNMDELKIFMIYDYDHRIKLNELKELESKGVDKHKTTNKSNTLQASD